MIDDKPNSSQLLNFVLDQFNLSLEDVLELQNRMKESEIIQKHKNAFSIWQGTNGRWYTYLPDESKHDKRKLLAKSTEEKLNREIITYYKSQSKEALEKQVTLEVLYPSWLQFKAIHTEASSSMHRIDNDWYKYYAGTDIVKKPIVNLDKVILDEWAHSLIRRENLRF